jgi:hypothetical protein
MVQCTYSMYGCMVIQYVHNKGVYLCICSASILSDFQMILYDDDILVILVITDISIPYTTKTGARYTLYSHKP